MQHFYLNSSFGLDNWFNYQELYKQFADTIPNNGSFVEIGSWTGRSICFFAVECANLKKDINIFCVDLWPDDINSLPFNNTIKNRYANGELYNTFLDNISSIKNITPIRSLSKDAVKIFDDHSIDILFVDGDHSYDAVLNDISLYLPKIKNGGIISGHDYNWISVAKAVKKIFGTDFTIRGNCWIKQL